MPPFMLEPVEGGGGVREEAASPQDNTSGQRRLRNESYLGAVNRDIHIRAGLQVTLNLILWNHRVYCFFFVIEYQQQQQCSLLTVALHWQKGGRIKSS